MLISSLTIVRNAHVFSPEDLGVCDVLVGAEQVLAVAPSGSLRDFSCGIVIEADGGRMIPGLIDSHVHLTGGGGESGPASRVPRVLFGALALGGTTTSIGVLGTDCTTRSVASLVAVTLGLRQEGLSAWCWTGGYEVPAPTLTGSVRGDITFVDPIIGVGELAISDHRSSQPSFDEFVRIAADCHVGGLLSGKAGILHLHLGDGARGLDLVRRALAETELPARIFHPTHVNRKTRLFDEAIELARRGSTVDVTAFPVDEGEDAYSAEDAIERYLASDAPRERLTCSSDGGGCLPKYDLQGCLIQADTGNPAALAGTLRTLLLRGHSLTDVLPIFTSNAAKLLKLPHKGTIQAGADADLVILDDQHQIRTVIARGRVVVKDALQTTFGMFDAKPNSEVDPKARR